MKGKKKIRFMAGTLALGMFLTGCKKELDIIVVRDNTEHTKQDFTTSATTELNTETNSTEITIQTENNEQTTETELIFDIDSSKPASVLPEGTVLKETFPEEELPKEETVIPTEPEIEELPENIIAYTTTNVNLRAGDNTKSLIINVLQPNECVYKIMSCDNNWDLVKVGDQIGYICRDYLAYTNETYEQEHNFVFKNDVAVTTTALNFRSGPSTDYPIKKTLITKREKEITEVDMQFKKNEELEVLAEVDDEWLLVEYNGEIGYVYKAYTMSLLEKLQSLYPELGIEEFEIQKVVFSKSGLNIREGNSIESGVIRTLEKYESLRVFGEYDEWYFVMTNEHEFGYVHSDYVEELKGKTVITDESEQRMYMYNDNEQLIYTPVTTGKDSTPTDIGLFNIHYMATNIYLNDNNKDWVFFWLNCNGNNEGIHDAWWRQVYGEESRHTNGSNGCTNTPYSAVKTLYYNSSEGQRVLVHK